MKVRLHSGDMGHHGEVLWSKFRFVWLKCLGRGFVGLGLIGLLRVHS